MTDAADSDRLRVALGPRSYDIVVGAGVLDTAGAELAAVRGAGPVIVVTDAVVAPLHLERLGAALGDGDIAREAIVVPAGEATKNYRQLESLLDALLDRGVERGSTLVAFGGGVIGDLVGFAAAVLLRGVDYVQIPTTLLAQVDSAVGGKTAINTRHGKNLVGAFHQPRLVLADTGVLDTLAPRELRAGYGEIVKYGLLGDAEFFAWLEQAGAAVLAGDAAARRRAVTTSCAMKAAIVGDDEREHGRRALLNLGHTFAHALEAEIGYDGGLLHGEAVAAGLCLAFDLSARLGMCIDADAARVRRHLGSVGLPTGLPARAAGGWDAARLLALMGSDKKVRAGRPRFVLARGIGAAEMVDDVDPADVIAVLDSAAAAA